MGLPVPDLDDKTFDAFVKEARSLITRYAPEWTDHNLHDPGITFMELFAWLAEMQIYQLNQVTDSNYIQFLKLMGLSPFDAKPARVEITFENMAVEKDINAGRQIYTLLEGEKIVFEAAEDLTLLPVRIEKVFTVYDSQTIDNTSANNTKGVYFAAFGEKAPEGSSLSLAFDKKLPEGKDIQITVTLFEEDLPPVGNDTYESVQIVPSVTLKWEYFGGGKWKELPAKKDETLAFTKSGKFVFTAPADMEETKIENQKKNWIRCRLKQGRYEIVPLIRRIKLNTISAIQVETVENENLGAGRGLPGQTVSLDNFPVITNSQVIQVRQKAGVWETWQQVDDFELSSPDDSHYRFEAEKGEITFGNGLNGRIPLASQEIRAARYQTTRGAKGNLSKERTWRINGSEFKGISGTNIKEAAGGKVAESIERAKARAKKDFRTPYRAITSNDYEQLTLSTPGLRVARAKAVPDYNPEYPCTAVPGTVTVVVVPYTREETAVPLPGKGFLQTVFNHLDKYRVITTDLHVLGPEYVEISVTCKVHIKKKFSPNEVEKRVRKALEKFLSPLKGGPEGKGWPFGRSVFLSEIYQRIDKVEGVDYATDISLSAEGEYQDAKDAIKISPVALVFSGKHQIEME